jgi:hypothetical protein
VKDAHNIAPIKIDGAKATGSADLPPRKRVTARETTDVIAIPTRKSSTPVCVGVITKRVRTNINFTSPNPTPAKIERAVPTASAIAADLKWIPCPVNISMDNKITESVKRDLLGMR